MLHKITKKEKDVLREAAAIYEKLASVSKEIFSSPEKSADLFLSRLIHEEKECFDVLFLNQDHSFISVKRLFTGTINQAGVYPREIIKEALELNAAAIIVAHNHPGGDTNPSREDINITKMLKEAASMFEIKLLDHLIIGSNNSWVSLARLGEIS